MSIENLKQDCIFLWLFLAYLSSSVNLCNMPMFFGHRLVNIIGVVVLLPPWKWETYSFALVHTSICLYLPNLVCPAVSRLQDGYVSNLINMWRWSKRRAMFLLLVLQSYGPLLTSVTNVKFWGLGVQWTSLVYPFFIKLGQNICPAIRSMTIIARSSEVLQLWADRSCVGYCSW